MESNYTYQGTLAAAERVNWRVEDVIGGDKRLDFSRAFLPESLARTGDIPYLSAAEKTTLNQIRGHGYLCTFGLVEEFILPFVLDHARLQLHADDYRVRALLQFATEEAKHIHLFKTFRREFEEGFGKPCAVIGPPSEVARTVLSHHPLAVALAILHIEWMTQAHYVDSVKDDGGMDPQFKSLLKHHWMEEAQHARLDTLMVEALASACSSEEVDRAIEEYFEIGAFLDAGMKQQAALDLDSLTAATGRVLAADEQADLATRQHQALRWTFLGSGMSHASFLATLGALRPAARERVEQMAKVLS
jgi:hypothetical protein